MRGRRRGVAWVRVGKPFRTLMWGTKPGLEFRVFQELSEPHSFHDGTQSPATLPVGELLLANAQLFRETRLSEFESLAHTPDRGSECRGILFRHEMKPGARWVVARLCPGDEAPPSCVFRGETERKMPRESPRCV